MIPRVVVCGNIYIYCWSTIMIVDLKRFLSHISVSLSQQLPFKVSNTAHAQNRKIMILLWHFQEVIETQEKTITNLLKAVGEQHDQLDNQKMKIKNLEEKVDNCSTRLHYVFFFKAQTFPTIKSLVCYLCNFSFLWKWNM